MMRFVKNIIGKITHKSKSIIDYNIVGLNDEINVDVIAFNEMNSLKAEFMQFEKDARLKLEHLYHIMREEEWATREKQKHKRLIIDEILAKIDTLYELAKLNKIYNKDCRYLKQILLELLFQLFGTVEDFDNLNYTISYLEHHDLVPQGSQREVVMLTPIGRWY